MQLYKYWKVRLSTTLPYVYPTCARATSSGWRSVGLGAYCIYTHIHILCITSYANIPDGWILYEIICIYRPARETLSCSPWRRPRRRLYMYIHIYIYTLYIISHANIPDRWILYIYTGLLERIYLVRLGVDLGAYYIYIYTYTLYMMSYVNIPDRWILYEILYMHTYLLERLCLVGLGVGLCALAVAPPEAGCDLNTRGRDGVNDMERQTHVCVYVYELTNKTRNIYIW